MQGNNHDDVRRHNLSVILRLVHRGGAASRAELTRVTGLNRSTVAALVGELAELGLVEERGPGATNQVGRPSMMVAGSDRVLALAVNPEIDAVTIGLVGFGGTVRRRIRHPLAESPSAAGVVEITTALLERMRSELPPIARVTGIGVAVPGLVRAHDGLVRHAPHLGWIDEPLAEMLEAATGLPVFAANDASTGVQAERHFGAGRGLTDLIYLNGGASGIGGGLVVGGAPVGGVAGYAGEFGHMRVGSGTATDSAGIAGTLEAEVTRRPLLDILGLDRPDPDEFERALLSSASPELRDEVHRQQEHLAIALAGAVNILNPQLVVLGGFLASLYNADPGRLRSAVGRFTLREPFDTVRICPAELGSNLLITGAAELVFERLLDDPAGFLLR